MPKYKIVFIASLIMLLALITTISSSAQAPAPEEEIVYHNLTGMVRFIGSAKPDRPIQYSYSLKNKNTHHDAAISFLTERGHLFGLKAPKQELVILRENTGDNQNQSLRYQQMYENVPVLAGEIIVHLDSQKNIISASGEILPNIELDTTPSINIEQARQKALEATAKFHALNTENLQASEPKLWIYNPGLVAGYRGPSSLVWRIEVTQPNRLDSVRQLVLVDAKKGGVVLTFNQLTHARNRLTYDAHNAENLPGNLICTESDYVCLGSSDAINAHTYAAYTYDFYLDFHGRDSIDNAGAAIISTVNYGENFKNAFWNGSQMVYGTGFASALDVVAHEITHGITEHESNLFYYWQSGAINESLSDVWGELIDLTYNPDKPDLYRWLIGENLPPSVGAIRSMKTPTIYGDPDRMTSPNYYTQQGDNGGVHYNSGVNNKAIYLMVDGDTFNGYTISGIGIPKVASIYYYVQTNLLTSGADYEDLYYAVRTACTVLTGSEGITKSDCEQVKKALDAVEMNQQPVTGYNPQTSACQAPQIPFNYFFDDFESLSNQWAFSAISGGNRWSYGSPYGDFAYSGAKFLYADDWPEDISDSFAQTTVPVMITTNSELLFQHAYAFEHMNNMYYDGGVLEYSTDSGLSWHDAGHLINFNGYKGTIYEMSGNPLGGQPGFVGVSNGYVSTRLSLAPLTGESVIFRWRMGIDSSIYYRGWWLDDVQVYECIYFADVHPNHWAFSFVENLAKKSITSGCATNLYCPEKSVSRAEMAIFLLKSINGSDYIPPQVSPTFPDINDHWAKDWIEALKAIGITSGYPDGTFRPNEPVSRAEMAVFLLKSINGPAYVPTPKTPSFPDVNGHWASDWIETLKIIEISGGYPDGSYRPNNSVSRAEMAVFLSKSFKLTE